MIGEVQLNYKVIRIWSPDSVLILWILLFITQEFYYVIT